MTDELLDTLRSFVPALVARRLAVDPTPISRPTAERTAAAVLFADIDDFSDLAERLAEHGLLGAEELADLLNDYFGRLIDVIYEHGGEVTKFAGDALLALWPVPPGTVRFGSEARQALADKVAQAAHCGLALQAALDGQIATPDTYVAQQVGIGAGDVYSVHLGGVFDRWEFLLSGSPLVQMSLATQRANPGEVVLSPEAWALVQERARGQQLDQGFVRLTDVQSPSEPRRSFIPLLPPEAKVGLQAYIPAAILARLRAGHAHWLSELRTITVLFIKLPGYGTSITHPYQRTLPEAQEVMRALQTALYSYAGSINKLNVDDKGITLVAALGLPPLSHRDDAARAVHAALEMQSALEALGRRSAIGIATGWVYCGPVGNQRRREYAVVGNEVNMAARLMEVAESAMVSSSHMSDILCDEATFTTVRELAGHDSVLANKLAFERVSQLSVKGRTGHITAYRPRVRPVVSPSLFPPGGTDNIVHGRHSEQLLLRQHLEAMRHPAEHLGCSVLILEGETGIGKSHLVSQLLEQAAELNISSLVGYGRLHDQRTPFTAWQPVFRRIFGLEEPLDDVEALRSQVIGQLPFLPDERGFPALAIRLSPLLNAVLPLSFPENSLTREMTGPTRRKTTIAYLLRLLQLAVAPQSSRKTAYRLLVIENSQWMDGASWELAQAVCESVKPLLVVFVTRPVDRSSGGIPGPSLDHRLTNLPGARRIQLEALQRHETLDLVRAELGVDHVPEELSQLIQHKAGGNPFLCQELLGSWRELGLLQITNGETSLAAEIEALARAPSPESIRKMITGRIDSLQPDHQLLLKAASALPSPFTYETLRAAVPTEIEMDRLRQHLVDLERLGLLRSSHGTSGAGYQFAFSVLQEVAYNLLPHAKRRQIQERVRIAS